MIRVIMIACTLGLFFILGIVLWIYIWIVGRFHEKKAQDLSINIVRKAFSFILHVCSATRITIIGQERIPKDTAVLYVANHRSFFDILLIGILTEGRVGFIAKKEMEKILFLRVWMRMIHCLFLDRNDLRQGLQVILQGIDKLKNGISMCVFPEGTRNDGEELSLLPFKEGSLKMAEKSGAPIVPVSINNSISIFEKQFPFVKPAHVVVEFGEPIYVKELSKEEKKFLGSYTQERIQATIKRNAEMV